MNRAGCGSQTRGPDRASVRRSGSWCQCAVATVEALHEPRIYWTNLCCICNTDLSRLDELSVRPGVGRDSFEP